MIGLAWIHVMRRNDIVESPDRGGSQKLAAHAQDQAVIQAVSFKERSLACPGHAAIAAFPAGGLGPKQQVVRRRPRGPAVRQRRSPCRGRRRLRLLKKAVRLKM